MFEKWRQVPEVYIPGGFDLLHPNHTEFIRRCIESAQREYDIDTVVFGLLSDEMLHTKGPHRPFFTFSWRAEDVRKYVTGLSLGIDIQVEPAESPDSRKNRRRVLAFSSEYKDRPMITDAKKAGSRLVFASPVNQMHTTDVEREILQAKQASNCEIRKVGAVLLHEGQVRAIGINGGEESDSCRNCTKCKELVKQISMYGKLQSPLPECDFPHAERHCLEYANPGDWLLTTTSPCNDCAGEIIQRDLARVVYLTPYHNQEPVQRMQRRGIQVRQAGLQRSQ